MRPKCNTWTDNNFLTILLFLKFKIFILSFKSNGISATKIIQKIFTVETHNKINLKYRCPLNYIHLYQKCCNVVKMILKKVLRYTGL